MVLRAAVSSDSSASTSEEGDEHDHGDEEVPDDFKDLENPNKSDDADAIEAGMKLYEDECARCHGDHGEGDGPDAGDLKESPPNLVDHDASDWGDDFFFFRVTIGEPEHDMPSFEKSLSDKERWQIITYLRSLQSGSHDNSASDTTDSDASSSS